MHIVKLPSYHRSTARAQSYVGYMSHREEHLPAGERRELYGIGDRYKDVGRSIADPGERETAFKQLIKQDASLFRVRAGRDGRPRGGPIFHRPIFTLDERAAQVFAGMPRDIAERTLRDTFQKAMRASAFGRQVQGVYAIHWHGGEGRAAHPHIHALLSPARINGRPNFIGGKQLVSLKGGWNRAVEQTLARLQRSPLRSPVRDLANAVGVARGVARAIARPGVPTLSFLARGVEASVRGTGPRTWSPVRAVSLAASFVRSPGRTAAREALNLALSRVPTLSIVLRIAQALDPGRSRGR